MQHGDISNQPPARLLVVFEGLLGIWQRDTAGPQRRLHLPRLRERVHVPVPDDYMVNTLAADAIRDATVKGGWHVDVVTWHEHDFALALEDWLSQRGVHTPVIATSPAALARELVHRPDIYLIYDPDARHLFTYGPRGVHMDPYRAGGIGRS